MKKQYVTPLVEMFMLENGSMVCASKKITTSLDTNAEWGGTGPYAHDEWNTEEQGGGTTGGFNTSPVGDDEDDLPSRGKAWGDLWGDFGF